MGCNCGKRRGIIASTVNGNTPIKTGLKQIGTTFKQDMKALGNAVRPSSLSIRKK